MSPVEYRLRERIDQLSDALEATERKLERLRRINDRNWSRARELRRSRDLWRVKAETAHAYAMRLHGQLLRNSNGEAALPARATSRLPEEVTTVHA